MSEAGDLLIPIRQKFIAPKQIHAELGEIILGKKPGRQSDEQITFFKSVGIAIQDSFAANIALKNAIKLHLGKKIDLHENE